MDYKPGKHIISSLKVKDRTLLVRYESFREEMNMQIEKFSLQKLGEVYHNFHPEGFTAVVCLSESHISLHTWPEHGLINLDIYLSNHERDNDGTVEGIHTALCAYFDASLSA